MKIKRKITAIIFFIGAGLTLLINPLQKFFPAWLFVGVIIMFVESGYDSNWVIEKKILNLLKRRCFA